MALSPDRWLARLTKAMDDRGPRIALLRSYVDGNAPLPEGAEGCRDAYKEFQRKARTNFGELVLEAVVERLIPGGFTLNGGSEDDDQLRRIWRRSRGQTAITDVIADMLGVSCGYLMVSEAQPGQARITRERPEQVITEQSPLIPDLAIAALKVYRDEVAGEDVAILHLPGVKFTYSRPLRDADGNPLLPPQIQDGWEFARSEPTGLAFVPVFPFLNRNGQGEFESHTDVLDRINWGVLQRLVITAMQAYRQRALKSEDGKGLPSVDADGNEIDYDEMFKASPGALWELPAGFDLWESSQTDITPLLSAVKDDLGHLAAVTRTPMPMLVPDGANQSAEGAAAAREGLVFKTRDRQNRADAALVLAMGAALAIEQGLEQPVEGVEVLWEPLERRSLQERADASTKAQDLPWRTRMADIWGYSADRIDSMESERAADALIEGIAQPQKPAPVNDAGQQQA